MYVKGMAGNGNKQGAQLGAVSYIPLVKGLMLRGELNYGGPSCTPTRSRQNYAHHGQPLAHPYGSGFVKASCKANGERDHGS